MSKTKTRSLCSLIIYHQSATVQTGKHGLSKIVDEMSSKDVAVGIILVTVSMQGGYMIIPLWPHLCVFHAAEAEGVVVISIAADSNSCVESVASAFSTSSLVGSTPYSS